MIYKCKCGYKGELEWVKKIEQTSTGKLVIEGLGCPQCKSLLSSGNLKQEAV